VIGAEDAAAAAAAAAADPATGGPVPRPQQGMPLITGGYAPQWPPVELAPAPAVVEEPGWVLGYFVWVWVWVRGRG
jgi:hypothetical protein